MKTISFICLLCTATTLFAQAKTDSIAPKKATPPVEKKGILRLTERSIEGGVHTEGWSIGYNTGEAHTYYKTDFWHFGLGELKDLREVVTSAQNGGQGSNAARPFIFGKQNSFFMLQAGRSIKRQFSEKAEQRGVKVGYAYTYGATLGMLKPYYVDVLKPGSRGGSNYTVNSIRYSDSTENAFLSQGVYGASSFTKGLNEMRFLPGAFGRVGLNFDWLTNDEETLWSLQTGLRVDAFPAKIPLMVTQTGSTNQDKFIFFNLYAILALGKRQ